VSEGGKNELALFAGGGGGILGGLLLGWHTVCAVESDPYARDILLSRQNNGFLPPFPIWDDVRTFDGNPWRGIVDVVSGGFPCQDVSCCGSGQGLYGNKSGLWREMARIVREVQPADVWVENSPLLVGRGLARILADFAAMGYDAQWGVIGAHHAGALHKRDRIWILAHAESKRRRPGLCKNNAQQNRDKPANSGSNVSNANRSGFEKQRPSKPATTKYSTTECRGWWGTEPDVGRVADGVAARVDRLRCLGNGQVPQAMCMAWEILSYK
jgi:DNA (cytosine-5)-methyltransferase 1